MFSRVREVLKEEGEEEEFQSKDAMTAFSSSLSLLIISSYPCDIGFLVRKWLFSQDEMGERGRKRRGLLMMGMGWKEKEEDLEGLILQGPSGNSIELQFCSQRKLSLAIRQKTFCKNIMFFPPLIPKQFFISIRCKITKE